MPILGRTRGETRRLGQRQPSSTIWTLPPELRLDIYRHVFSGQFKEHIVNVANEVYVVSPQPPRWHWEEGDLEPIPKCPSLLLVCREMHREALSVLFEQTMFDIVCWDPARFPNWKREGMCMGATADNRFLGQIRKASILVAKGEAEDVERVKANFEAMMQELRCCRPMTSLTLKFCNDTLTEGGMDMLLDIFKATECRKVESMELKNMPRQPYCGDGYKRLIEALRP